MDNSEFILQVIEDLEKQLFEHQKFKRFTVTYSDVAREYYRNLPNTIITLKALYFTFKGGSLSIENFKEHINKITN